MGILTKTVSFLDYINRKLETKLLRYRLNMNSSGIIAIVLFYCVYAQSGRAKYLLVNLEEPAILGSDKNISDAIIGQSDSWHSQIPGDDNCKNTFEKLSTTALFKVIPPTVKLVLRALKFKGIDKLPITPVIEKWGIGTFFIDMTIGKLGGVNFEDQCMTPKDRNMKRKCKVTLVFPLLEMAGKVHWSRQKILDWFRGTDGRYEEDLEFSGVIENLKIRIAFPMDVSGGSKLNAKFEEIKDITIRPGYKVKNFKRDGWILAGGCDALLSVLRNTCTTDSRGLLGTFEKWLREFLDEQFKAYFKENIEGKTVKELKTVLG